MPATPDEASSVTPEGGQHRASRSQDLVDYERVATRYQEGRSLTADVLDHWGEAVRPYLPSGPMRVVDVGAGTGIFAAAWPRWTDATVVAVEPSVAMVAAGGVADPDVTFVLGMRDADSLLTALSDDEIAEGVTRLRAAPTRMCRLEVTLFVFEQR
jgi:ubiquinone/menaquinone biosynthesis C-methylase UbiE